MTTKLYLRDASFLYPGTKPSGEQSSSSPTWSATGATTLRTLSPAIGATQASLAGSSSASTSAQRGFLGMFASPPLRGDQNIGGSAFVFNSADTESSTAMNFWANALNVYVWRLSSGTKVGTIRDSAGTSLGGTEGGTGETVTHLSPITGSNVSALDRDIIVVEVWSAFTQGMATSYTGTLYYDGTTENTSENASVSNHASYIELGETLEFYKKISLCT